ncbi:hypothetical protein RB195_013934 [Necator americanus]|uniref:Uncharacterized protein n=1 Tax=Necator americanus TaxID=51031 RepID=A0ABR1DXW6_NECAM
MNGTAAVERRQKRATSTANWRRAQPPLGPPSTACSLREGRHDLWIHFWERLLMGFEVEGMLYYELLPLGHTVAAAIYSTRL